MKKPPNKLSLLLLPQHAAPPRPSPSSPSLPAWRCTGRPPPSPSFLAAAARAGALLGGTAPRRGRPSVAAPGVVVRRRGAQARLAPRAAATLCGGHSRGHAPAVDTGALPSLPARLHPGLLTGGCSDDSTARSGASKTRSGVSIASTIHPGKPPPLLSSCLSASIFFKFLIYC